MSARPSIFPPASEEADLIVSKWQRQSEELLLKRLLGTPEAGEELDDIEPPREPEPPYALTEAQERINYHFEEDW